MSETRSCQHCGAGLAADARFCESCGKPVAAMGTPPPPLLTSATRVDLEHPTTPRAANRGLMVGLAIAGVFVVLSCLGIAVFGYWFIQSKPNVTGQIPASSPQIATAPTTIAPANVTIPTTALPTQQPSAPTRVPPTSTLPPTTVPKSSPISVSVPSVCWLTAGDDVKSLVGMPTDFEQSEGSGDWWDFEFGKITMYGSSTKFYRQSGSINVFCTHYADKPPSNVQVPVGYTRVDVPMIGDGVLAYQKQNYQRIRFIKGNSVVSVSFSDTGSYVTSQNIVKLATTIAGRMPSTVSLKQPPALPRTANEANFAKYFGKFELGREDSNSRFIPTTTLTDDDFMRVSVETIDPQQRYSFWITDAQQNVYSVRYGVLGTRVVVPDPPLVSGEFTVHLEIDGVIYARRNFTLK